MRSDDVRIHHAGPDWTVASWDRLFFEVWRGPVTGPRAQLVADSLHEFAWKHEQGIAVLVVVYGSSSPPDSAARPIFAKVMKDMAPRVRGVAYNVPLPGIKGAAYRSVITGLSLLAREPYKTRAFEQLTAAATWIGSLLGVGSDSALIAQRIPSLVDQIDPPNGLAMLSASEAAGAPATT